MGESLTLEVWNIKDPPTPYHVQALVESIGGLVALGRTEGAELIYAKWRWKGRVSGLYEDSTESLVRRITGGVGVEVKDPATYFSLLIRSDSLRSLLSLTSALISCLGYRVLGPDILYRGRRIGAYGITRLGRPGAGAPGVIEVIVSSYLDLNEIVECVGEISPVSEVIMRRDPNWGALSRSIEGFSRTTWRTHTLSGLPYKHLVSSGGFSVEVGMAEVDCFISRVSLAGTFFGAPPMEPFSSVSILLGMPIREDLLDAIRVRVESMLELAGIDSEMLVEALKGSMRATGCL